MPPTTSRTKSKAPRQATACQWCRAHKLKCDAEQPACRNCVKRSVVCVTTNLRKPDAEGRRQAPVGRRRKYQQAVTTQPSPVSTATTTSNPDYPLPLPSPPLRTFETGSPERLLPGLFATPFHDDTQDDNEDDTMQTNTTQTAHTTASMATSQSPRTTRTTRTTLASTSTPRSSGTTPGTANCHHLLVQWLDLFFMQNPAWQPVFPHFRQGLAYTSEIPLPSPFLSIGVASPGLPLIPDAATMDRYSNVFFSKIHPLFPLLDRLSFVTGVGQLRDGQGQASSDHGLLASTYAVCSLAADEETGGVSDDGTRFLEAAYVLYAHIVARPSLSSVQALLLLTIALRNRNKDAASWGSLGQAIRLAQAINLHRDNGNNDSGSELASCVWWSAYILERTMELETGRPSAIRDEECDRPVPASMRTREGFDYFGALIRLARLKTRAIHLLYSGRDATQRRNRPVKDLLLEMGHLDRALLDWADTFPESVRPGRDIFCGSDELPLATFVALQYQQTMIALHRPALMSAPGFLRNRINTYCAGTPIRDRLHFSLCIGAASARAILKATNDLLMYSPVPGRITRLVTADQILLAVLVLGIYVAKVPMSRLNRSDLALVDTFGELVEDEYRRGGHDPEIIKGISLFRSQLCAYIAGVQGHCLAATSATMSATIAATLCSSTLPTTLTSPATAKTPAHTSTTTPACTDEFGFDLSMDATDLESSWAHFWNEDFEKLLAMPPQTQTVTEGQPETVSMANVTNMYLLGIPQSWP